MVRSARNPPPSAGDTLVDPDRTDPRRDGDPPSPPGKKIIIAIVVVLAAGVAGEGIALYLRDRQQPPDAPSSQPAAAAVPAPASAPAPASRQPIVEGGPSIDLTDDLIESVAASSTKQPEGEHVYTPEKAFDGHADTAWNEGADGPGQGEWIEARFRSAALVDYITVTPGWDFVTAHGRDLFTSNRYLTELRLEWDGGERVFTVPAGVRVFKADLGGVQTARFRIVATGVSTDSKWDDLAISEIRVFGHRLGK